MDPMPRHRSSRPPANLAADLRRNGYVTHEVTGGRPDSALRGAARLLGHPLAAWQQRDEDGWFWIAVVVGADYVEDGNPPAEPGAVIRRYRLVES